MANDREANGSIKIAPETIFLVTLALVGAYLFIQVLYRIQFVIVILLLAIIFSQAVEPLVKVMQSSRFSRSAAVIMAYLVLALFILAFGALLLPSLINQVQLLALNLPAVLERLQGLLSTLFLLSQTEMAQQFQDAISQVATSLADFLPALIFFPLQVTSVLLAVTLVLVISIYWSLASQYVKKYIVFYIVPPEHRDEAEETMSEMGRRVGGWVRGQFILSASIGIMTYIALTLLGMPYSVLLAIWAAVTELIPMAGPIIGAIPAVIIAFLISPFQALFVAAAYIIIQQLENHLLVPNIMSHEVGLHPLVVVLSLLIGAELLGLIGAILAVPIAAALQVLVIHLAHHMRRE